MLGCIGSAWCAAPKLMASRRPESRVAERDGGRLRNQSCATFIRISSPPQRVNGVRKSMISTLRFCMLFDGARLHSGRQPLTKSARGKHKMKSILVVPSWETAASIKERAGYRRCPPSQWKHTCGVLSDHDALTEGWDSLLVTQVPHAHKTS